MVFAKKDKLYLIGFMGSGKSTLGKKIARSLNYEFFDLDQAIESYAGASVSSIFQTQGEIGFRLLESECLSHFNNNKNIVIATGGGTPCFYHNMEMMLQNGCCVYIKMPEGALYQRLYKASPKRPLLVDKNEEELRDYIHELLLQREETYLKSHLIIDGMSVDTNSLVGVLKHKMIPNPALR